MKILKAISKLILLIIIPFHLISCGSYQAGWIITDSSFVGSFNSMFVKGFNLTLDNNLSGTFAGYRNNDFTYFIAATFYDDSISFILYASDLNEGDKSPFNLDASCEASYPDPNPKAGMLLFCEEIGCSNQCASLYLDLDDPTQVFI